MRFPQPSDVGPQVAPASAQDFGSHGLVPHRFGPSPPHIAGAVHALQSTMPPQPSGKRPQFAFNASHVFGLHPQRFGTFAPQVVPGSRQSPHSTALPQPSEIVPHSAASSGHV
jgi:hypothetical protein